MSDINRPPNWQELFFDQILDWVEEHYEMVDADGVVKDDGYQITIVVREKHSDES